MTDLERRVRRLETMIYVLSLTVITLVTVVGAMVVELT